MDLDVRQSGNVCTLKVKGRFQSTAVPEFDSAVNSALASGHINLILNLEEVPMIDSSGIGAVVYALRQSKQAGGDTKLVNPSPFVSKTFKMVGILTLFGVYPTEAEAVSAYETT